MTDSRSENIYNKITGSVTLLVNSKNYSIPANQITPVSLIIMILTSPAEMKQILFNQTWRNFDQSFIILDGNNDNGCVNAQSFLMEAWKNDILNVVFICLDHQSQVPKIYSFNPFTDFASTSWERVSVVPAIHNHPWTLIVQSYSQSKWMFIFPIKVVESSYAS